MRARIELPGERLINSDFDADYVSGLAGLTSDEGALISVTVGSAEDFVRNVMTVTLDGPDEAVRPVVTYLMDFVRGVNP